MRRSHAIRIALGTVLAALTLWLALRGTDLNALGAALQHLRIAWLAAALGSVAATLGLGIVRWRVLLGPHASWRALTDAYIIGQALNILLPIRLGEVARVFIAARSSGVPVVRTLTSIAIEKFADLLVAAAAMALLLTQATLPEWSRAPGRGLVFTAGLAVLGALLALNRRTLPLLLRGATRLAPQAWQPRLARQFADAADGLESLRNWRTSAATWLLSSLVFLAACATNQLLFAAFDMRLPVVAAVTLVLALQVGTSLASVPGNLGVFHYITVLVLEAQDVSRDAALAYAIALYGVAVAPKLVFAAVRISVAYSWSSLTRIEARA